MPRAGLLAGAAAVAAALILGACTRDDMTRLNASLESFDCMVRDRVGRDPCPEPEPVVPEPRYCYRTLAGIECYTQRVQFGRDPVWVPAAPPDIAP